MRGFPCCFAQTIGAFGPGEFMFDPDQAPEPPSAGKASSIADLPLAPLRLAVDAASVAESAEAVAAAKALSESLGVACVEFHAFGGNLAKQAQCSPDAFVQVKGAVVRTLRRVAERARALLGRPALSPPSQRVTTHTDLRTSTSSHPRPFRL